MCLTSESRDGWNVGLNNRGQGGGEQELLVIKQLIKSGAYASKVTCKTMCHLECVNMWTTRSCHFDWMSLENAGQGFRSSDRAAVFGVCGGRWSDRSRYNWLTIDQDGGSLGNSPSPHVVSPSQTNCLPFHFWTKGSSTSCQEWNP